MQAEKLIKMKRGVLDTLFVRLSFEALRFISEYCWL
jgi:hypothetical protein